MWFRIKHTGSLILTDIYCTKIFTVLRYGKVLKKVYFAHYITIIATMCSYISVMLDVYFNKTICDKDIDRKIINLFHILTAISTPMKLFLGYFI